jgi:membrane protease YdiL (CAAX protease family)
MSTTVIPTQARSFIAIALGASLAISALLRGSTGGAAPLLTMATPLVAVLVVSACSGTLRSTWRQMGWRRSGIRRWPAAIAVPAAVVFISYGCAVGIGVASFPNIDLSSSSLIDAAVNAVIGIVIGVVFALGEEIGWRGFLLPQLQATMSPTRAAVTTGFINGIWHLPLLLLTNAYDTDGKRWIVAPMVVVTVTLAGVFYAWLRTRSATVWPVAIAHSTVNVCFEGLHRTVVTSAPAALAYTAGEAGVGTVLVLTAIAVRIASVSRARRPLSPERGAVIPLADDEVLRGSVRSGRELRGRGA